MKIYLLINPDKSVTTMSVTADDLTIKQIKATYAQPDQKVVAIKEENIPLDTPIESWSWDEESKSIVIIQDKIPPNYQYALDELSKLLPAEKLGMGIDYVLLVMSLQSEDQAMSQQVKVRITAALYEASDKVEAIFLASGFIPF